MLNVRDYFALGNGTGDDTPGIQAALDAAETGPDKTVYIPDGDYPLGWRLFHPSGVTIKAEPGAFIYRNGGFSNLLLAKTGGGGGYTGVLNVRVSGGIWDGNLAEFPLDSNLFAYGHCEGVWIEDLTIRGATTHLIELNSTRHGRVRRVTFEDYQGGTECLQLDVASSSTAFGYGPYDGTPCDDVVVDGCVFHGGARAVGSHSGATMHTNVRITDNLVLAPTDTAFHLLYYSGAILSGNRVVGGPRAAKLMNCERALVVGNSFEGQTQACVVVESTSSHVVVPLSANLFSPAPSGEPIINQSPTPPPPDPDPPPPPPPGPTVTIPLTLVNPTAEQGITGWTVTLGALAIKNSPPPPWTPPYFFYGGTGADSRANQVVAIPVEHHEAVDAGVATLEAVAWQGSYPGAGDKAQITVDPLDAGGAVLGSQLATVLEVAPTAWKEVKITAPIPVGARSLRYGLRMVRIAGSNNDGYLDRCALSITVPA